MPAAISYHPAAAVVVEWLAVEKNPHGDNRRGRRAHAAEKRRALRKLRRDVRKLAA